MVIDRFRLLVLAVLTEGGILLLALGLSYVMETDFFQGKEMVGRDILHGTIIAVPPLLFFIASLSPRCRGLPLMGSLRKTMISDIRPIFLAARLHDLVLISILAGIAEESLFRGVLQQKLGITAASVIFGIAHAVTPAYAIVATAMGFYLGMMMKVTSSIVVPVQAHIAYDFMALVYLMYFLPEPPKE